MTVEFENQNFGDDIFLYNLVMIRLFVLVSVDYNINRIMFFMETKLLKVRILKVLTF